MQCTIKQLGSRNLFVHNHIMVLLFQNMFIHTLKFWSLACYRFWTSKHLHLLRADFNFCRRFSM